MAAQQHKEMMEIKEEIARQNQSCQDDVRVDDSQKLIDPAAAAKSKQIIVRSNENKAKLLKNEVSFEQQQQVEQHEEEKKEEPMIVPEQDEYEWQFEQIPCLDQFNAQSLNR